MAYNLEQVRDRVINGKLDDPTYDAEIVDQFINDAQREIFNTHELPFMEKVFDGQLPAGGVTFEFPDDFQTTQSLKLTSPDGATRNITGLYMKFNDFNRSYTVPENNEAGAPTQWTMHNNKIYLSRPTDQSYILQLWYLKTPDLLEDDADVPEVPEEFSEALVLGAYYRVLERNEDFDLAAFIKNGDYTTQTDLMVQRLGKRQTGKPMTMGQPLRSGGARRKGRV